MNKEYTVEQMEKMLGVATWMIADPRFKQMGDAEQNVRMDLHGKMLWAYLFPVVEGNKPIARVENLTAPEFSLIDRFQRIAELGLLEKESTKGV